MKIVLIIYVVSWLILFAFYIRSRSYVSASQSSKENLIFYLLLIVFSPFIVLTIPYILISNTVENKKKKKQIEECRKRYAETTVVPRNDTPIKRYNITFKELPFKPEKDQVIYVENIFDESVNAFIMDNYDKFVEGFKKSNLEFVYLPLYFNVTELESKVRYYAPYLASPITESISFRSSYLLDFMLRPENRVDISPSLLYLPNIRGAECVYKAFAIDSIIETNTEVSAIVEMVNRELYLDSHPTIEFSIGPAMERTEEECEILYRKENSEAGNRDLHGDKEKEESGEVRFRRVCKDGDARFYIVNKEPLKTDVADDDATDVLDILDNLLVSVKSLRLRGVALGAIHEFIDKQEPISPLVITEDLRLFLPLYNNIEIELSAQRKALYFLFLNHPEGIILQHLENYHSELMNYYRQTNNGVLTPKMEESMKKLEMYGNNQLHVIITRIRGAFCSKFDEHLACNYFISGEKGEPYRIPLDRNLVKWEE